MLLNNLLKDMVKRQASDLHIRVGSTPIYRIEGKLFRLQTDNITPMVMEELVAEILDDEKKTEFEKLKELYFAFGLKGLGRFRVNIFHQRGTAAMAIRSLAMDVPDLDKLGLPDVIKDLALKPKGLLLVTGGSGSGKSTTCAAILNHINDTIACNIVTVEDPIEYLHRDKKSMVAQREIGSDTPSYSEGIRGALKQDHDVLYAGNIRHQETLTACLSAAETGHLVLSTMDTLNAAETLTQCAAFFDPGFQGQIRSQLANCLLAILSLKLLPASDGGKRIAVCEVLFNGGAIREGILKPEKYDSLPKLLEEGHKPYGTQSFDQDLMRLYQNGKISLDTARRAASRPDDFTLRAEGFQGSDRSWRGA